MADIIDLTSPPAKAHSHRSHARATRQAVTQQRRRQGSSSLDDEHVVIVVDDLAVNNNDNVISLSSDEEDIDVIQTAQPLDLSRVEPLDLTSPARRRRRDTGTDDRNNDDVLVSVSTRSTPRAYPNYTENDVIVVQKENRHQAHEPLSHGDEVENDDPYTPKRKLICCPICMDHERTIRRTGRQLMSTTCGHIFCDDCINRSMQTLKCCPSCRKKITKKTGIHPIFL